MVPCVAQTTTLPTTFAEDAENYSAAGCPALEVWLTKLEKHLEKATAEDTKKALADRGLRLLAASYQGGLLTSQGQERKIHFEHFRRRLDLCQTFEIPTLVVATDLVRQPEAAYLHQAVASLAEAGQWAAAFGVRLAVEFRAESAFCSSLDTAITLVEQCREPNVGICLDIFHYYKGPSKPEDLERLTPQNLFLVQLSDVAGIPRELMTDSDRVMPGEGDFRLEPVVHRLRAIGYSGPVSLELMNPELWKVNGQQVVELGLAALKRCLGISPDQTRY
jgi:2-keto-myo-inositol isomerase